MAVYKIDPTKDIRWETFVQKHPNASIFHTPGWLEALRRTYDYEPIVFTTSPPGTELTNGIAFCRITGWLGGSRLVSLPFSDHCAPLAESSEQLAGLVTDLRQSLDSKNPESIEIRWADPDLCKCTKLEPSENFLWHKLDLRPSRGKGEAGLA